MGRSGLTKPNPDGWPSSLPAIRSMRSGNPNRLPLIRMRAPSLTSARSARLNATRSSRAIARRRHSSRAVAGCGTRARIWRRISSLDNIWFLVCAGIDQQHLQVADVGVGAPQANQVVQGREKCERIIRVEVMRGSLEPQAARRGRSSWCRPRRRRPRTSHRCRRCRRWPPRRRRPANGAGSASARANSRLRPPMPGPVTRTVVSPAEITQAGLGPAAISRLHAGPPLARRRPAPRPGRPRESQEDGSPCARAAASAPAIASRRLPITRPMTREKRGSPGFGAVGNLSGQAPADLGHHRRRHRGGAAPSRRGPAPHPARSSDPEPPGPEPMALRSSPMTSEIARVITAPWQAAARRPPFTRER